MSHLTTWKAAALTAFAIVTLMMAPLVAAQLGSPSTNHEQHHGNAPVGCGFGPATQAAGAACAGSGMAGMPGMPDIGMMTGTPAMGAMMQAEQVDLIFIDMMIAHHKGAIAMAQVAVEQGEHPELVQLAGEIVAAQQDEVDQLQSWRDQWYPDAPTFAMDEIMGGMWQMMQGVPGMGAMSGFGVMGMGGMMDPGLAAEALRAAPEPFDLAFINAMIPHHLSALMMAEMAVQQATHPELAAFAQTMIEAQEREIAQMRAWRTDWYGATATPSS
jgi:uncharacterized protein (DUF305 family)